MRKAAILSPGKLPAYAREKGNVTIPLVGRTVGAEFLNGMTIIVPGSEIPFHIHNCEESVLVVEGKAIADINGQSQIMLPHDVSWIPANVPHRFRNSSDTEPLKIFWTYTRTDAIRTLVEDGTTREIAAEWSGS